MFYRATKAPLVLLALLAVAGAHATAYGQRETRDRPDSVGSRSIGGRDGAETRRDRRQQEAPADKVDEQLRKTPSTPNVDKLRASGRALSALTAAGAASEADYAAAVKQAQLDYENRFKAALQDEAFANSHAAIRLEDFARAYIITLHPAVGRKLDAYELARLRAMTTTYNGYEQILREKVPELDEATAEELIDEAKRTVKALLSK